MTIFQCFNAFHFNSLVNKTFASFWFLYRICAIFLHHRPQVGIAVLRSVPLSLVKLVNHFFQSIDDVNFMNTVYVYHQTI